MSLNFIKTIFSKLKFKDYILIILLGLVGFYYVEYKNYYNKSLTPIIIYDTDSLFIYKNKLKEVYKEKEIFVQDLKNIKEQNTLLSNEINKLKNNPIVVTKTELKVQLDTVFMNSDEISLNLKDSIYNLKWSQNNQYYNIDGLTNVKNDFTFFNTQINKLELSTNLILDIIEDNKKIQLIGKTDNPYINIINMDGVILDPSKNKLLKKYYKQKKWNLGPYIGVGLTSNMKFQPSIGLGISYGIIQF